MRDLVVFVAFVALLPYCFVRPWVGVLTFSFLAYNRTQDLTWSFARGLPISQLVAVAMILGWVLWEFRPILRRDARLWGMVGLVALVGLSMFVNRIPWSAQGDRYVELAKIIFVALLTAALLNSRQRLRQIMGVITLALGFYGVKNALLFMLGSRTIVGPGGMLKDNNDFALAMCMNLPLLWYLGDEVSRLKYGRICKRGFRAVFFLTILTVISTTSRGGFLAMGVAILVIATKTRWKVPALVLTGVIGVAAMGFLPEDFTSRMQTITEGGDTSTSSRLVSWQIALNMIRGNPVFGVGFNNFVYQYFNYSSGVDIPGYVLVTGSHVAHNSYLQMGAESGLPALLTFLFVLGSSVLLLRRTRRAARRSGETWILPYTHALEATFLTYAAGAFFLNRAHFDLVYQLVAISVTLPLLLALERVRASQARQAALPPHRQRGTQIP